MGQKKELQQKALGEDLTTSARWSKQVLKWILREEKATIHVASITYTKEMNLVLSKGLAMANKP